jgi:hypothetical protein
MRGRDAGPAALDVAMVIPIYKPRLDPVEHRRVSLSVTNAPAGGAFFVGPRSLDASWYREEFPEVPLIRFANRHFRSVDTYSRWMLTPGLYRRFRTHRFVLICQTDAFLLRPLPTGEEWEFDYLGAPWDPPKLIGWDAARRRLKGRGSTDKRSITVGNGGLSLRRTEVFSRRLRLPRFAEHPQEDKAISYFAPELGVRLADTATAARYFMETGATTWCPGDPSPDVYGFHALGTMNPELERLLLSDPNAEDGGKGSPADVHHDH